jgi:hypothetical protein
MGDIQDFLGNALHIGDTIVFAEAAIGNSARRDLIKGQIVKFTNAGRIKVKHPNQRWNTFLYPRPIEVIKA